MLTIRKLVPSDLTEIVLQPSQRRQYGLPLEFDSEQAEALAQEDAWTALLDGRVVCCIVIAETFPGKAGLAMAMFAQGIGAAHVPLTRFAHKLVAQSPLPRIEAVAEAHDAEAILQRFPNLDPWELLQAVLVEPTPPCRWAMMTGLQPVAVLRKYGAAGQTHVLFERIR